MSTSISALIPELQPFAKDFVEELGRQGLQPRVTSTLRTHAEQQRLYRRYLQGLQPYYVAPPGTSPHEYGYAFDLVCNDLDWAGQIWLSWGGEWGGRSTRGHSYDPVHFQYPGFVPTSASTTPAVGDTSVTNYSDPLSYLKYVDPYGGLGEASLGGLFRGPAEAVRFLTGQESYWDAVLKTLGLQ